VPKTRQTTKSDERKKVRCRGCGRNCEKSAYS